MSSEDDKKRPAAVSRADQVEFNSEQPAKPWSSQQPTPPRDLAPAAKPKPKT